MNKFITLAALTVTSLLGFGAALAIATAPASAEEIFVPAPPAIVAYGQWEGRNDVQGRVTHFEPGSFRLMLHVAHEGFLPVDLHQGTVINPRGLTLHRGMLINIHGYFAHGAFQADVINLR
jgi:hypothetical protein